MKSMASAEELILSLLLVSEKAACIARICRQNDCLLKLLVQEKKSDRNPRFAYDFKTLADVLIQEMIKFELETKFPALKSRVYGEENNCFTNILGESIVMVVDGNSTTTMALLLKILDGNEEAARLLTQSVYNDLLADDIPVHSLPRKLPDLDLNDLAIWVDPIDATSEYITGEMDSDPDAIAYHGLNCVSVLIGVFSRNTGKAITGIINQPFSKCVNGCWQGLCFWGISLDNFSLASVPYTNKNKNKLIAVSLCEEEENCLKLKNAGYKLICPSGAGYKCLLVILGLIEAYVLSKGSTYYWDTCACHAIIKALDGNIWNCQDSIKGDLLEHSYREKIGHNNLINYRNSGGIIVCKDKIVCQNIVDCLR